MVSVNTPPLVRNARSLSRYSSAWSRLWHTVGIYRIFFGWQVVQVFGGGFAGVDLVLDAVQAGHHQGREAQVGVGQRIREARLDAAAFVGLATYGMRIDAERLRLE